MGKDVDGAVKALQGDGVQCLHLRLGTRLGTGEPVEHEGLNLSVGGIYGPDLQPRLQKVALQAHKALLCDAVVQGLHHFGVVIKGVATVDKLVRLDVSGQGAVGIAQSQIGGPEQAAGDC